MSNTYDTQRLEAEMDLLTDRIVAVVKPALHNDYLSEEDVVVVLRSVIDLVEMGGIE